MKYEKKEKELREQFTKVTQQINQLQVLREQIRGKYTLLEELEKEEKPIKGVKK